MVIIAFIVILFTPRLALGEYITLINIQQGSKNDSVYIKLLENDAPLTVQNFRNYVSNADYSRSLIHRVVFDPLIQNNFIVQGGGFTFDPQLNNGSFVFDATNASNPYPGGLQPIAEGATPVVNEFLNTNVRGTLAMAKLEGDPDSATSQWFFNRLDNLFLDTQNGGFTVFAEVLGNGMSVVDNIANQSIVDISGAHPEFDSIPLLSYSAPNPVVAENLVLINSIVEVLSVTPDINYGAVTSGSNLQPEVVLLNTGGNPVSIGNIGGQDSLSSPYSFVSEFCSNGTLLPGQRCSLIALFSPQSPGTFDDSFDIEFPAFGINYVVKLTGIGGPIALEPDITSELSSINFGEKDIIIDDNQPSYGRSTTIVNIGEKLNLNSITLSPDSNVEYSISGAEFGKNQNCINVTFLDKGKSCRIRVIYRPLTDGKHTANLIIVSNDPDESPFEIPIFATAIPEDSDGVDKSIEDGVPDNGDGNNDDVLDSRQSNVVSLIDRRGTYNTYVSEQLLNQTFSNVRIVDQNADDENPDNIFIEAGVHEFTIENVAFDATADVGLLLPAGVDPSAYYIFGKTPKNATPHWFEFTSDGETGPVFIGVATITSPTGKKVQKNVISLRFKNGGRGDSGSGKDNKIVVKSGINYNIQNNNSGGFLSFFSFQIMLLSLLYLRRYSKSL